MKKNLISIIVPVYNVENYLPRCVNSILAQTYKKLEIILVDDGSTDRCGEICDEYVKKDARVRIIHKKNGGLSDARNVALDIAQGEYIGFVDSDDWIEPDMFECLYQNRVFGGITICGWYQDFMDHSIPQPLSVQSCTPQESVKLYLQQELDALYDKPAMGSYAWNKLYHYTLFEQIRYPVNRKYEDIAIILMLLKKSSRVKVIDRCLYHYWQRENSISRQGKKIPLDWLKSRKEQWQEINENWPTLMPYMKAVLLATYFFCLIEYVFLSPSAKVENRDFFQECQKEFKEINKVKSYLPQHIVIKFYMCIYTPFVFVWLSRLKHLICNEKKLG